MDTAAVLSTSFTPPLQSLRTVTPSVSLNKAIIFPSEKKKAVVLTFRSRHQRKAWKTPCSGKLISTIKCGAIAEISEKEFRSTVLESDRPVLVEFIATWCGPCRLISPAMEWVAQEYDDKLTVVKIDHDANPQLIEEYKVYGLPTLILFKNGQEVPESRREGAITKAKLKEYVDGLLEQVSAA